MIEYHVLLRDRDDHEMCAQWRGVQPWSHAQAHDFLLDLGRLWPRLRAPGVPFYLAAEPVWPSREAHVAALAEALLVS